MVEFIAVSGPKSELTKALEKKKSYKLIDLAASDTTNIQVNEVAMFRNLLVKGIY